MAISEEILLDIKVQDKEALENIGKLSENNKVLKDSLTELKKAYKEGEVSESDYAKKAALINAQIKENTSGIRENSKEIKTNAAQVSSAGDSINGMRARVADLTSSWNSLSASARESDVGKAIQSEIKSLNEGINTANISVGNFKDNIGNYPDAMANVGLSNTTVGKSMQSLGITSDMSMKQMAKSVGSGVSSVSKSFASLLLNPVVLFFSAIVAAVMLLVKAFNRSEESSQKLNRVMGALGGVFNGLLKALEPVANFIVDVVIGAFTELTKAADKAISFVSKGLRALGFDEAADSLDKFTSDTKKAAKAGQELEDAEFALQKVQRESRKIQLEYQRDAEKLRQIRDDESKSVKERMDANIELGKVLKKQSEAELAIANEAVRVAKMRIKINGETSANLDELAAKETEVADIKERITGQESEQLANMNSLKKEAAEKDKAIKDAEIKRLQENAEAIKQAAKDRAENLLKDLQNELELYRVNNELKKVGAEQTNKEIYESELFAIEKNRADKLKALQIELEGGLISEKDFLDKKALLIAESNLAIAQNNADFEAAENERKKEARAADFENELAVLNENSERALALKKEQLDLQMAAEIEAAKKTGASIILIEKKYNTEKKKLDKAASDEKLSQAKTITDGVAELFGKTTTAGKLAASASVAIDTYKGAAAAISTMGATPIGMALGIAQAATIIASGVKAIANINSVSEKKNSSISGSSTGSASSAASSSMTSTTYTNLPTLSGMYSSTASQTETAQIIQSSQPNPVVSVTDITLMQKSVEVKEKSKL